MNPLKLLFTRHAQSIGNLEKRMQGNGEFDLSPEGRLQAEKLAQRLVSESWHPTCIYSSPLKRTVQTSEILRSRFTAEPLPAAISDLIDDEIATPTPLIGEGSSQILIHYADELREFQNGVFEGLTWREASERYPDLCKALESSPDWIQIPGAESLEEARARSRCFIQRLLDRHHNGEQVLIVSHSWILQHLIAELLGCDRSWRLHPRNTALFEFWIDRARWERVDQNRFNTDLWQIRRFNDYHHLMQQP